MGEFLQQRSRDRDALPLPSRQPLSALADPRVVALGQRSDELVRVGGARRRFDLLAAARRPTVGDIAGDRLVEEHRLLRDDANLARAASAASRHGCPRRR